MDTAKIESILLQHVPRETLEADEDVKEYMVGMLSNPDAYEDVDSLVEGLSSFLGSEEESMIHHLIQDLKSLVLVDNKPSSSSSNQDASPVTNLTSTEKNEGMVLGRELGATVNTEKEGETKKASDENHHHPLSSEKTSNKKLTPKERRQQHRARKSNHPSNQNQGAEQEDKEHVQNATEGEDTYLEDDASAWKECLDQGKVWGGRGFGGRGAYAGAVNSIHGNIQLSNVSLSVAGMELLQNTTMNITRGHKYGLIGRNGVGKSTLLSRLANKSIPGMPVDMRILLVKQQMEGTDENAIETLVQADTERTSLLREQEELEKRMEMASIPETDLNETVERLGEIATELDAIQADTAEQRAVDILQGLRFDHDKLYGPTRTLSGGWRMRLALARALFCPSDLLLLDECTNHLDLHGLGWLIDFLQKDTDRTLIVVSHDRSFLDAICTDTVVMDHQRLDYHVGNISDWERQMEEKAARETQILDAAERQRTKAQAFVQKQQAMANKKSADPNKQRQAKMIREKKLDRIGNYREDGKRYKLNSLKKLGEDYVRLAQKVQIEVDEPVVRMRLPNPTWPPGVAAEDAIVRFQDFSFQFKEAAKPILNHVTLNLARGSKIALVGPNGIGKSTLVKIIAGELAPKHAETFEGEFWVHPNIRIGHVDQYSVEALQAYEHQTCVEYAEQQFLQGKASSDIVARASGNVRQYLGAFGLGGKHAHRAIGKLSGGERMRLCFATAFCDAPQLLLLDESTNHVDLETLDALSSALNEFDGSVLMVSHNQAFLSGFCKELWAVEDGQVTVTHSDTESFDEIFSSYRSTVMKSGSSSMAARRQQKVDMARRATKQRENARQNTALL